MITHRCEGSLKACCSIRYTKLHNIVNDPDGWVLGIPKWDGEYDVTYLSNVCRIAYCPFCGKKLEVPE